MSARRLTTRDYKRTRRGGWSPDLSQARLFGAGLAAGLAVAGAVYVSDRHASETPPEASRPTPREDRPGAGAGAGDPAAASHGAAAGGGASDGEAGGAAGDTRYDFYQMLPKFEVVVPEKERGSRPAPTAQIDKPGVYFLQAGSYRDPAVADRVRAQLGKLGIDATVQRVAVDSDVWHRVRIGPIRDLKRLNQLRAQLRASDLDALVIRVDD